MKDMVKMTQEQLHILWHGSSAQNQLILQVKALTRKTNCFLYFKLFSYENIFKGKNIQKYLYFKVITFFK